jgi:hypothetical protein
MKENTEETSCGLLHYASFKETIDQNYLEFLFVILHAFVILFSFLMNIFLFMILH